MKTIATFIVSFLCLCQLIYAQQPPLKFNMDGTFKIVQFTDIHYIHNNPESAISIERINEILDAEKPDLVVLTGDIIYGNPAKEGLLYVLKQISDKRIPFACTFGNHDDEQGLTRAELYDIIKTVPYNLTATTEGLSGVTNFILPVKSNAGNKDAAILYCIDSHAYSSVEGVDGYDYIKFDQIQWYREKSKSYAKQNGGHPIPSLAFFHIPLPEYNQAATDETAILIGSRKEKACAPRLNSGLFAAMKEMGDIMGMFVGHDHDCDYAVLWKGIMLAYGRYTGGNTVYNNLSNGARVIELTEGEKGFKTWIHLKGNEIVNRIKYPDDFIKKDD
ncbi:MAG: metallophosphoesterase family protein [Tannerellaceae bacterium]|jgi:hypothetical protein|nr:metallophosphoesterase family protein [Tannerellaceae bacterium]